MQLAKASRSRWKRWVLRLSGIHRGGANFLAALGVLCYTEFAGKLMFDCRKTDGRDHASENFNRFFDRLGPGYQALRASGLNVYDVFRCGLAHEYYVKANCRIAILGSAGSAALGRAPSGE
jgi:hypothetical protein